MSIISEIQRIKSNLEYTVGKLSDIFGPRIPSPLSNKEREYVNSLQSAPSHYRVIFVDRFDNVFDTYGFDTRLWPNDVYSVVEECYDSALSNSLRQLEGLYPDEISDRRYANSILKFDYIGNMLYDGNYYYVYRYTGNWDNNGTGIGSTGIIGLIKYGTDISSRWFTHQNGIVSPVFDYIFDNDDSGNYPITQEGWSLMWTLVCGYYN